MLKGNQPNELGWRTAFTLVELLVVIAIIGILIALLLPAVQAAREAARRTQCANHLKQLSLGLHNYHAAMLHFPPGTMRYIPTAEGSDVGSSCLSWIARILPYLEQAPLYDKISWTQLPGNGGVNTAVRNVELAMVRCPSDRSIKVDPNYAPTNYVGCRGVASQTLPQQSKPEGMFTMNFFARIADVRDGTSNTMMVSECLLDTPWIYRTNGNTTDFNKCLAGTTSPIFKNTTQGETSDPQGRGYSWFYAVANRSWNYSTRTPPNDRLTANHECELWTHDAVYTARSRHPGGVQIALADGAVRFVSDSVDIVLWRALGTFAGGELVGAY